MKNLALGLLFICLLFACAESKSQQDTKAQMVNQNIKIERPAYTIAIHGGAGTILKENMTPELEKEYLDMLHKALDVGEEILKKGGSAMDAVEQTIILMENSPLFNAGKGSVFNSKGENEMDASFMNGETLNAGAIAGVKTIKNPIRAAREVLEYSEHVILSGKGADDFAKERELEIVDPSYFYTERRWKGLQKAKAAEDKKTGFYQTPEGVDSKFGTVGCVALDKEGNIAAGTSTGGMTNKKYNRIGDSPIIGAGTYANNKTCGVSSTGHGEFFIRYAVAYDISALVEYKNFDVKTAANYVINNKLKTAGGTGGVIAVDFEGNVAMPFNTEGMYRGYAKPDERVVKIYKEDE